jgi:hypothetical protein
MRLHRRNEQSDVRLKYLQSIQDGTIVLLHTAIQLSFDIFLLEA